MGQIKCEKTKCIFNSGLNACEKSNIALDKKGKCISFLKPADGLIKHAGIVHDIFRGKTYD